MVRNTHYLFKLRLTKNVKRYIERMFATPEWTDAGQGWEGREGSIQLTGWSKTRRIVILRRVLQGEVLLADEQQLHLAFVEKGVPAKGYEYAVLVTDLHYELRAIAQFYRDRGDAENAFDELKNQWGWGGFTLHHLRPEALPLERHDGGARLQLVESVRAPRAPEGETGGDHQPTIPALGDWTPEFSCGPGPPHHHPDARPSQHRAHPAHDSERTIEGMEACCGAVASEFSLAACMRVHCNSGNRFQLACKTKSAAIAASHIGSTAVFRFIQTSLPAIHSCRRRVP